MEQEKVQVFVKLCESSKEEPVIEITDNGQTVEVDGAEYEVHKALDAQVADNELYYQVAAEIPHRLLQGQNCTWMVYGATGTGKTQATQAVVPSLIQDVFTGLKGECTVQCSIVEVYLNRLRDLVSDSHEVYLDAQARLQGCTKVSCIQANDVLETLQKARVAQTKGSSDAPRDSSRSTLLLQLHVTQKLRSVTKESTLQVYDLVGSEFIQTSDEDETSVPRLVSHSLQHLHEQIRDTYCGIRPKTEMQTPVLSQLLGPAFGGHAFCTVLLTGRDRDLQPTLEFGKTCASITNSVTVNEYKEVNAEEDTIALQQKVAHLTTLTQALAGECHKLQQGGARLNRSLELVMDDILAIDVSRELNFTIESRQEHQIRTEQMKLRSDARRAAESRDQALRECRQLQSELAIAKQDTGLQSTIQDLQLQVAKAQTERDAIMQERDDLQCRLQTSVFRENEAVVFLRQLRKFYYRLQKKMAAEAGQGLDKTLSSIPGAPGLSDLVDMDQQMVKSGLLETTEVGGDVATTSKASDDALKRSLEAATAMNEQIEKPAEEQGIIPEGASSMNDSAPSPTSIITREELLEATEARQKLYSTPSGKYIAMRESALEEEILAISKKLVETEALVKEEKDKVTALTEKVGASSALERLKTAKETKDLKDKLARKENDFKAVVLKMNELHLTGKSLAAKSNEKNTHVAEIEKALKNAQASNHVLSEKRNEANAHLVREIERLKAETTVTSPSTEEENSSVALKSRFVVPFSRQASTLEEAKNHMSVDEPGEWMLDLSKKEFRDIETQTDETPVVEVEVQTENSTLRLKTAEVEVQTELETNEIEIQTDPIDLKPEVETNEICIQTEPTSLNQLLGDVETTTNEDGSCVLCGLIAGQSMPVVEEANVDDYLFMCESPVSHKDTVELMEDEQTKLAALLHANSHLQTSSTQSQSRKMHVGVQSSSALQTSVMGSKSIATESNDVEQQDTQPNQQPIIETCTSVKPSAKSSFMERLQKQAKKHDALTPENDKNAVPEFMRKFKKIGARNMGENIIETSGEAPAQEATRTQFGETLKRSNEPRAPPPAPTKAWTPRKKKSDDDSDSSDSSFARSFMQGAGASNPTPPPPAPQHDSDDSSDSDEEPSHTMKEAQTLPNKEIGNGSEQSSDDESESVHPASPIHSRPLVSKDDDSSSSDDSESETSQKNKQVEPPKAKEDKATDTKSHPDANDDSSDEESTTAHSEEPPLKAATPPNPDKNDLESESESETEAESPQSPLKPTGAKNDSESESESETETESPPSPVKFTRVTNDSESESESETETESPPSPVKPTRVTNDSESESESETETESPPSPVKPAKTKNDSESESESETETESPPSPVKSKTITSARVDDDSSSNESSTAASDEAAPKALETPVPAAAVTKAPSKRDESSDEESSTADSDDEPAKVSAMKLAPTTTPQSKKSTLYDSSDDESDSEASEAPARKPAPAVARKVTAGSDSDSDSDESTSEPSSPIVRQTTKNNTAVASSTDADKTKIATKGGTASPSKAKFKMQGGKLVKVDDESVASIKSPTKGKPKFVLRGGKLVKDEAINQDPSESSRNEDFDVITRNSSHEDLTERGQRRVGISDGGEWGNLASPRRTPKAKSSNFVIKHGKLVKTGESPKKSPKHKKNSSGASVGSASFKIVGGKLVKQEESSKSKKKDSKKGKKKSSGSSDAKKKKKFGMF